jgi:hypothetical protein
LESAWIETLPGGPTRAGNEERIRWEEVREFECDGILKVF